MNPTSRKYLVFVAVFLVSVGLDQATKIWARAELKPRAEAMVVVQGYFDLRYSENTGAAFGLFRNAPAGRYLLGAFGLVALGVIGWYLKRVPARHLRLVAELGLLGGGAVGNIIDRVAFGRVTDFVVWKIGTHEWPTFNIADAALVVGVIGMLFDADPKAMEAGQGDDDAPGGGDGAAGKA